MEIRCYCILTRSSFSIQWIEQLPSFHLSQVDHDWATTKMNLSNIKITLISIQSSLVPSCGLLLHLFFSIFNILLFWSNYKTSKLLYHPWFPCTHSFVVGLQIIVKPMIITDNLYIILIIALLTKDAIRRLL